MVVMTLWRAFFKLHPYADCGWLDDYIFFITPHNHIASTCVTPFYSMDDHVFFSMLGLVYFLFLSCQLVDAFPDAGNPSMVIPGLQNIVAKSCSVHILQSVGKQLSSSPFDLSKSCPGPWSKVVLTVSHQEAGVQYDRFYRVVATKCVPPSQLILSFLPFCFLDSEFCG